MRNIFPNIIYLELDGSIFSCSFPLELSFLFRISGTPGSHNTYGGAF